MNAAVHLPWVSPRRWLSPTLFDYWAGLLNPLWTLEQPLARLIRREPAGQGATTLVLRTNRHWGGMRAGQHVTLGVEINGRRLLRSYSPTRLDDRHIAITVKAVEGGRVSRHLVQDATPGTLLTISQAFGDMAPPEGAPLLLLAAGSGITPMRSLLRDLAGRGMPVDVDLYYWERTAADASFLTELHDLAAAHPRLRVHLCFTRDERAPAPRIDRHPLDALDDTAMSVRHVLACGPGGFVDAAQQRVQGRVAGFLAEAFSLEAPVQVEEGHVQVRLARTGRDLLLPRGTALLDALEAQGLRPKHGCRMGICNSCTCSRVSGGTRHLRTGEEQQEPAAPVRLCVMAPTTDLVLDL